MPRDKVYPHDEADTKLINLQHHTRDEIDVYIAGDVESENFEPSPFRNPFCKTKKEDKQAVQHYKMYFYRKYLTEEKFRKGVHSLEGKTLGSWCYPRPDHGEVIVDLLNEYSENGIESTIQFIEDRLDTIEKEDLGVKGFREYEAAQDALDDVKEKLS